MTEKKTDWKIIAVAILCITVIELTAIAHGINGIMLTAVVGTIAALAGLVIPTPKILGGK